jgi:CheY-like chemotaxis protein
MKVLIAEDNVVNQKILTLNLKKWGCSVMLAGNGNEALICLESNPDIQLVISDIRMPEMDGYTLLKTIKSDPRWRHIPVVMCSELQDFEALKSAIKLDCAGYLLKPFIPAMLFNRIYEILKGEIPSETEMGKPFIGAIT